MSSAIKLMIINGQSGPMEEETDDLRSTASLSTGQSNNQEIIITIMTRIIKNKAVAWPVAVCDCVCVCVIC